MIEEILNNRSHGASVLFNRTLIWLSERAHRGEGVPSDTFDRLVRAHPGMACFFHLRNWMQTHGFTGESIDRLGQRVHLERQATLDAVKADFPVGVENVGVYSHSGMVVDGLAAVCKPALKITVAHAWPVGEGADMAACLVENGLKHVVLLPDGAFFSAVPGQDVILLGCDAYSPSRFINKAGSAAIVRLAQSAKVPVFVIPGPLKRITEDLMDRMPLKQGPRDQLAEGEMPYGVTNPVLEKVSRDGVLLLEPGVPRPEPESLDP